jgi:WD40 repeat protein
VAHGKPASVDDDASRDPATENAPHAGASKIVKEVLATVGAPAFTLPDHRSVTTLGFTPDGRSLVSVSHEKAPESDDARFMIRSWDVAEKKLAREVELEWEREWNRSAGSMILSKDRTKVISSLGGQLGLWDVATGKIAKRLVPPPELQKDARLMSIACTPDLSLVACGRSLNYSQGTFQDAYAIVWDANSGKVVQVLTLKHADHVPSLSLSADGKRLATIAEVWEVESGKLLLDFRNSNPGRKHPDPELKPGVSEIISSVGLSPDGKLLAVSDMLGVKLIDVGSGKLVQQIDAPYRYYSGSRELIFSADGQLLARLGTCMKLHEAPTERVTPVWSTATGKLVAALPIEASDVSFSDDGGWLAVGLSDLKAAVAVWQVAQ